MSRTAALSVPQPAARTLSSRTPRLLHPVAWWVWAVGCATAASRTTNPLLLLVLLGAVVWVVVERRDRSAGNPLPAFLLIGVAVLAMRLVMTVAFGNGVSGPTVLFTLPTPATPDWIGGVRLGGPVTLEALAYASYGALQLVVILACLGAANALASPRRLLRYLPATLYDVGTAMVVALTFAPQMVADARRIRAARALRGHDGRGMREMARLARPVLEGALERGLDLAASMESRGYGTVVRATAASRRRGTALTLVGLTAVLAGLYGLLDGSVGGVLGLPLLAGGALVAASALLLGARRDWRSAYRRERFAAADLAVCAVGLLVAAILIVGAARGWAELVPGQVPLTVPQLTALPTAAVLAAALPGILAPPTPGTNELGAVGGTR